MTSWSVALEHVTGEPLLVGMFGDESEILRFGRMESAEWDVLQSKEVVVARQRMSVRFGLVGDVQPVVGDLQDAHLGVRNRRDLPDAFNGGADDFLALVNRRLHWAQILQNETLLADLSAVRIEIRIVHVHYVGGWEDSLQLCP